MAINRVTFPASCVEVPRGETPPKDTASIGVLEVYPSSNVLCWKPSEMDDRAQYTVHISKLKKCLKSDHKIKCALTADKKGDGYVFAIYEQAGSASTASSKSERDAKKARKFIENLISTDTSSAAPSKDSTEPWNLIVPREQEHALREEVLNKNPDVRNRYEKLVQKLKELSEEEFWQDRRHLLLDEFARRKETPLPSSLPNEDSKKSNNSVEWWGIMQTRQILMKDPAIRTAHAKFLASGALTKDEFWTLYYRCRRGLDLSLPIAGHRRAAEREAALQFFNAYKEGKVDDHANITDGQAGKDLKSKRKEVATVSDDINLVRSVDDVAYSEVPSQFSLETREQNYGSGDSLGNWGGGFGTGESARVYADFTPEHGRPQQASKNKKKTGRLIREHNQYGGVVVRGGEPSAGGSKRETATVSEELEDLRGDQMEDYVPLQIKKHKVMSHVSDRSSTTATITSGSVRQEAHGVVIAPCLSNVTTPKLLDSNEYGKLPLGVTMGYIHDIHNRPSLSLKESKENFEKGLPRQWASFIGDTFIRKSELLRTFWNLHKFNPKADKKVEERLKEICSSIVRLHRSIQEKNKHLPPNLNPEIRNKLKDILDHTEEQLDSAIGAYCSKTNSIKNDVLQL